MARKPVQKQKVRDEGKTRFELRFDDALYEEVKRNAEEAGISINQLMQGIARWAMKRANPGARAHFASEGVVSIDEPGCIWFGHAADLETDEYGRQDWDTGVFVFELDFTERNVIRESYQIPGDEE
jgi:hypothetical protein